MKRTYPYLVALAAEVAVFHRRVLFERGYLFPWDFRGVHLPLATFVAGQLKRGQMPLWEPYTYCGNPIFANIQAAIFYPPVLLATALSNLFGAESLARLLAIAVCAQIFFAGVCTFALLRRLGAQSGAAFVSATVYQLGCFFAVHGEHMGAMHGASWIPLAWLAVVELRVGWRWRWIAALALALAMTILAGLPQVAVAGFGSAALLAILVGRDLGRVLVACGWALALAAVQWIPTAQLEANSVAKYRAEWLKTGGGIKLGALWSLVIPNYWSVFDLSKFHGPADPTFLYLYCGSLTVVLALAAIFWKPDVLTRRFAILLALTTLWMLGDSTIVGRAILAALPVNLRIGIHPEYTLPVFALAIAVLAGLGANRLPRPSWQAIAGAIVAIDLLLVSANRPFNQVSITSEPGTTHDSLDGSTELAARLRALVTQASPPLRYDTADAPYGWSSVGPILRLPTANGCDPMAPERVIQLRLSFAPGERWGTCYQVVNTASPIVGLENAGFLLSKSPEPWPKEAEIAGYTIYRNPHVLPRFFFAPHVEKAANLTEAARRLHAADFDPEQTAIVEGEAPAGAYSAGEVRVVSYAANEIALRTRTAGDAFLIAADTWYPGWEAAIDGRPAKIDIADVAFRGVRVPAGQHEVRMRFVPRILWLGAAISALALAGVGWAFRRRKEVPRAGIAERS